MNKTENARSATRRSRNRRDGTPITSFGGLMAAAIASATEYSYTQFVIGKFTALV
jgi:hypothetical protein